MADRRLARPWHVAHVIGHLRTGGAERQLLNYLLAADRADFRHSVLCLEPPGELAAAAEQSGVRVLQLPVRTRFAVASVARYAKWFKANDVAIVHTHMHHAALWGRAGALAARVPVLVTTEHGKELWKGPIRLAIDRYLSRCTARHIAVSRDGMELRRKREKVDPRKLVLIPNGVPVPAVVHDAAVRRRLRAELGLPAEAEVIGTVGRVVTAKGYEHLLEALRRLRATRPGIVWLAVGDGDQREGLAARAAAMGLDECVVWAGSRRDVPDLLQAMDIWVMSSIREGLPVALLEAMAAQMPIVATRVGGIPDAVRDGVEGLLVAPADGEALADAIGCLLDDADHAADLSRAARSRAMHEYGINAVARRIEDVYRQELARYEQKVGAVR